MFEALLNDSTVAKANERIARMEEDSPFRTRRRLLATSLRLSKRMMPDLWSMTQDCVEELGVEIPVELFVFPSPQHNAMCFRPEDGRLFIMFASSLLDDFQDSELKFVMGHELGHHIYNHHAIPIGYLLRGKNKISPHLALQLFAWSRYAEISADRAGAYCAKNIEGVYRALFMLASGLTSKTIQFQLEDFLKQVDQMQTEDTEPGAGAPKEDWFSTHPFSPLRVKALQLFDDSELVRDGGQPVRDLELGVQTLMSLMEPNYLEGRTEAAESMRRLLFATALVVARADGEISKEEIEIFEHYFGKGSFSDSLDLDGLEEDLDKRTERVKEHCSPSQVMQVVRDMCLVVRAENQVADVELQILLRVANGLEVSDQFVRQMLDAEVEPD
mgnify:CR=1 FL=1